MCTHCVNFIGCNHIHQLYQHVIFMDFYDPNGLSFDCVMFAVILNVMLGPVNSDVQITFNLNLILLKTEVNPYGIKLNIHILQPVFKPHSRRNPSENSRFFIKTFLKCRQNLLSDRGFPLTSSSVVGVIRLIDVSIKAISALLQLSSVVNAFKTQF